MHFQTIIIISYFVHFSFDYLDQWVRGMADGTALLNSVSRIESLRASVEKTDPHRIEATRPAIAWPPSGSVRGGTTKPSTIRFRPVSSTSLRL